MEQTGFGTGFVVICTTNLIFYMELMMVFNIN